MIAEGIQNPTTGEIVKVQGAGTVYDEEKNSVAIGKDTVASGQDQFVFGCKNALDVEKAEIVGGGRKIVLEGKVHISLYNDDKQRQARVVFAIPVDRENYDFSADTEVPTVLKNFANFDKKMAHIAKIESIIIEDGLEELYDFCYIGGPNDYLDSSDNHKIGDFWYFIYAEKTNPSSWSGDHFDPIRGYTKSYISGSTGKNIRTLDWNGHEYLTGSLAIGKYSVAGVEGQLVFGKGNIEDNTKAEIVGGKTTSDIDGEYKRVYWYDSDRGIRGFYLLKKVASDKDSFEQYVKNLYSVSTVTHNTSLNTPNWQNAKGVYKYMAAYTGNDYSNVIDYSSDNYRYDMLEADNKMISLLTGHSKGSESATCTWLSGRLTPTSIETLFNLRTLDWQGNQWNAGDVTCDDGEGNTISLRDLASHKANVYETENIEALDGTIIEKLKAGDIIIKKGENSNHAYRVSFKNATGMCLTYADAENVETIAYDKTGDTWAKTDKTVTGITGKAAANHNHDTAYAALNHNHDDAYAAKTHSHAIADVTGLQAALAGKMVNVFTEVWFEVGSGSVTLPIDQTVYNNLWFNNENGKIFPVLAHVTYDNNGTTDVADVLGICISYTHTFEIGLDFFFGNVEIDLSQQVPDESHVEPSDLQSWTATLHNYNSIFS